MLRLTAAYLAGVVTIAAVVYLAGGRPTLAAFIAGAFCLALVVMMSIFSSAARMRRAARLLSMMANLIDGSKQKSGRGTMLPAPAGTITKKTAVQIDIEQALKGLKCSPQIAQKAAAEAVAQLPLASFEDAFRRALTLTGPDTRKAAA